MNETIETGQGYVIRPIDIEHEDLLDEVMALQREAFSESKTTEEFLAMNAPQSSTPTLYLGAFNGDELLGCTVFTSHAFFQGSRVVIAHQAGGVVVSPRHRKRGIFQHIVNGGKHILRERGSGFIFGFPNKRSGPIFAHKLDFRTYALHRMYMPTRPELGMPLLRHADSEYFRLSERAYVQNEREIYRVKKALHGDEVVLFRHGDNFMWGRYGTIERGPLSVPVMDVGGLIVNAPHQLSNLFFHTDVRAQLLRFSVHHAHPLQRLFRHVSVARHREPFIIFDLNESTTEFTPFTVSTGIVDAY